MALLVDVDRQVASTCRACIRFILFSLASLALECFVKCMTIIYYTGVVTVILKLTLNPHLLHVLYIQRGNIFLILS